MTHRILFFGMGDLGLAVLKDIVKSRIQAEVTFVDINEESLNLGRQIADQYKENLVVNFDLLDATVVDDCRQLIDSRSPQIIVNLTTLLPVRLWWDTAAQPGVGVKFNDLGFGPWISLQMKVLDSICEAVSTSTSKNPRPVILNASYPDVSNAVMTRKWGLELRGTGNIRLLEKQTISLVATTYGVPESEVSLIMHMNYSHLRAAMMHEANLPDGWELQILLNGNPVEINRSAAEELLLTAGGSIPKAELSHDFTASVITEDLDRIIQKADVQTQMAGPRGKVGGWPVRLIGGVPELYEIDRLSVAEPSDGICAVDDAGTVLFTEQAEQAFLSLVGENLTQLKAADIDETASRFQEHFRSIRERVLSE